jgi:hypothetical protein
VISAGWVRGGELVGVSGPVLRELVSKYLVTRRPVNRGTAEQQSWDVEYLPVALDERMVRAILLGNDPHPRTVGNSGAAVSPIACPR